MTEKKEDPPPHDMIRRADAMERFPDGRRPWPPHAIRAAISALPGIAALEAVQPPDLVEAGAIETLINLLGLYGLEMGKAWRVGEGAELMDAYQAAYEAFPFVTAHITAQAAQIAGLDAELSSGSFYKEADIDALMNRAEAAEAKVEELEAQIAATDELMGADDGRITHLEAVTATLRAENERLRGALRKLIDHTHNCEKQLTEELHHADFCGESLPLTRARAALEGETK